MTTLATQAHRLTRRSWRENPDALAQELQSIFLAVTSPTTGPIAVNLKPANGPAVSFTANPQDGLNLPILDFDSPLPQGQVNVSEVTGDPQTDGSNTVGTVRSFTLRSVLLGRCVSFQSGSSTYTFDLYPNGTAFDPIRVTGVVPLHYSGGAGVEVPANRWTLVTRLTQARTTQTEYSEAGRQVSLSTAITIESQGHFFVNQDFLHDDLTFPGNITLSGANKLFCRDSDIWVHSGSDGNLDLNADDGMNLNIGSVIQLRINNDNQFYNSGVDDPVWNFATDGELRLTNGKLHVFETFEVDGAAQFDGIVTCNSVLDCNHSIDLDGTIDVSGTSDLHGKVHAFGEIEIDGALNHDGSTAGVFGHAPAAQVADIGTITNSTGGSVDLTIVDPTNGVGGLDYTKVRDNFADLASIAISMRSFARAHGWMA